MLLAKSVDLDSSCVRSSRNKTQWLLGVLLLSVMALSVGCEKAVPRVTVDNTGDSTMIVKVDGKEAARIPARGFQRIPLTPGTHNFEILADGKQIFSGIRMIEESNSSLAARNYIFSPRSNQGYAVCKVVYGSNAFSEFSSDAMVKMAEYYTGEKVDKEKYAYMKVKPYAEPMKSSTWFELPSGVGYILHDPPQVAYTRSGSTSKRALTRISKSDQQLLKQLHKIDSPNPGDLEDLIAVSARALDSLSQLEPLR